jgi:hypothetical protein
MQIGPGGKAYRLHRNNKNYHIDHEDQTNTAYELNLSFSCLHGYDIRDAVSTTTMIREEIQSRRIG